MPATSSMAQFPRPRRTMTLPETVTRAMLYDFAGGSRAMRS